MFLTNCPFCQKLDKIDNYSAEISNLSVSNLRLNKNQSYKGYCTLIFNKRHAVGLEDLSREEYAAFMEDLRHAAKTIFSAVRPALMNYASLGNIIPHLHFHIIPRYKDDPRWGKPIWTTSPGEMHESFINDEDFQKLIREIKKRL